MVLEPGSRILRILRDRKFYHISICVVVIHLSIRIGLASDIYNPTVIHGLVIVEFLEVLFHGSLQFYCVLGGNREIIAILSIRINTVCYSSLFEIVRLQIIQTVNVLELL